jgi:predicted dehydrogenase
MKNLSRRQFLQRSALASAALSLPAQSWSNVVGANEAVRVAVVGFNGQGRVHIEGFRQMPGVRVVALCDADSDVLEREAKKFRDRGEPIDTFTDVRRLLESKEVDVISTATPNHWHALITIWACQTGKDVYVEKPVSHNVAEGRKMVDAARKYNRMVQTGTQSRSSIGIRQAMDWVRGGSFGKILAARGLCYKRRDTIGKVNGAQPIPAAIDYDLWCGPAPLEPLRRYRLHYDWHWVWSTGNGDLGNQGIHEMDLARWGLGVNQLSDEVLSIGGRFGYHDDGETANTQMVMHQYESAPLIFEVRGLPEKTGAKVLPKFRGASVGAVIHCEHGDLVISANGAVALDAQGKEIQKFQDKSDHRLLHRTNFIEAIRQRDHKLLNADILEGHISSALCHTGNISYRLGQKVSPPEIAERIQGDAAAEETYGRLQEHLAANDISLDRNHATLGQWLRMDPRTERFPGQAEANALLTRPYRRGFAVPRWV